MSKRSKNPYHEVKRLRHHFSILELKYGYAKEAGMSIICDRLAKKAARIQERIQQVRGVIAVSFRRDWDEAIEMNLLVDLRNHPERFLPMVIKEKTDGMVQRNPDSRESN